LVRRGFSLIELLVVILIIVIVIALLVPALGGARDIAKAATTRTVIKEFGNAVDRYRQDHAELSPGIFDETEMGGQENADTFGMSAMKNMILALAGGVVYENSSGGIGGGGSNALKDFGPTQAARDDNQAQGRGVREDLIGAEYEGNPDYFQPSERYFVAQERPRGQFASGAAISNSEANIPDLVDAWGNPLLLWVEDDAAPDVTVIDDFACIDSGANADEVAHFYWASNAAFLKATELGKSGQDQTTSSDPHSLLGEGISDTRIQTTLTGLLGNPASPAQELDGADPATLLPASARGRIVVQSAGTNGLYAGNTERASKNYDADASGLRYGLTYFTDDGTRRLDQSGSTGSANLIEDFDDIWLTFGN